MRCICSTLTRHWAHRRGNSSRSRTWRSSRATQIAKQTLGFSRQATLPESFRPAELLDNVLVLLHRKLEQKGVRVTKQCDTALEIVAVTGEIRQVLWNLLTNALDAVPNNG